VIASAYLFHDHVVAEHVAGVAQQQLEQAELRPGQRDHPAAPGHRPGGQVQSQVGVAENVVRGLAAPQQGPDPGQQLTQRERLDQVVIRPRLQPGHPVIDRVPRGEHQDRGGIPPPAEHAARVEPVHHRHQDIQHDQVDRRPGQAVQRVRAVHGRRHRVPGQAQRTLERVPHVRVIVHDQQPSPARHRGLRNHRLTGSHAVTQSPQTPDLLRGC
jgi:hypothetical protein